MAYQAIENHGIIGNMHTSALVAMDGTIDWLCLPHFDSPSIFAAILDDKKGGSFRIAPNVEAKTKQIYWSETNILITRFLTPDGVGEIVDYMPAGKAVSSGGHHQVIRHVKAVRGQMPFRMECFPAFNYARDSHETKIVEGGAVFSSSCLNIGLATPVPLQQQGDGVIAEFTLKEGEETNFVLRMIEPDAHCGDSLDGAEAEALFKQTVDYWRGWLSKCTYHGRWREMVHRSALVLKLLTFLPTGAIVAAPTCSLPEAIEGPRNWDYRYTWMRDAAFTLYGLLRIGFTEEAAQFMNWLEARCREPNPDGSLQIVYGIDGRHELTELTLDHLDG